MLQLKCTGLILTPVNALDCAEGSIDVQVQIEFDNTYAAHTKTLHIGYFDERGVEHGVSSSLENNVFKIPGPVFAQAGIIFISVHFSKTGDTTELETNAVQYRVQKTAGGVGSLPASYIWEPVVKRYVQEVIDNGDITFSTDQTLSKPGQAADAKAVGDEFSKLWEDKVDNPSSAMVGQVLAVKSVDENGKPNEYVAINPLSGGSGEGLSDEVKETMLLLFNNLEYTNDMSSTVKRLSQLFSNTITTYTITNNLTNATNSNTNTNTMEGVSYIATITPNEGFLISEVTVMMNGVDVTSSVYSNGEINILSVSGDIVITVTTKEQVSLAPAYQLAQETVFDGATFIDTEYKLFDVDKDWSIEVEFSGNSGVVFSEDIIDSTNDTYSFRLEKFSGWYWRPRIGANTATNNNNSHTGNVTNTKYVFTRNIGTEIVNMYVVKDGVKISDSITCSKKPIIIEDMIGKTNNLSLGYTSLGEHYYFNGTIHDFKVYNRVLEVTEINEYLGV